MLVTKGLIIDDPWVGFILNGQKTWEMRAANTSFRGWFGLIRKGTGAVWGVARMVGSLPSLSTEQMIANIDKHRIPESTIRSGQVAKWNTPWVLTDVRPFELPVRYKHKSGAQNWVNLDPEAIAGISRQFATTGIVPEPMPATPKPPAKPVLAVAPRPVPASAPSGRGTLIGQVELTQANIAYNHIYLRSFFHKFPSDAVGGSNKSESAAKEVVVDWGDANLVRTDLDGEKKFFRNRSWQRQFFADNGVEAGDVVLVEETGPYRYRVGLRKLRR